MPGRDAQLALVARARSVVRRDGWAVAVGRSRRWAGRYVRTRAATAQVNVIGGALGERRVNVYFWHGLLKNPGWKEVQDRVEALWEGAPDEVEHFVRTSLERTTDPMVVLGLSRHPLTHRSVRCWLHDVWNEDREKLADRLLGSRLLGASFASSAQLLLDPSDAADVLDWVQTRYEILDAGLTQFVDSAGWAMAANERVSNRASRNRLVIASNFNDIDSLGLHLLDAERVSVFSTADTFGRADFTKFWDFPDVGSVEVEHVRTRIPRFCQEYVDIHEATARVARSVTETMSGVPGLLAPDLIANVEVATADFLFFEALKFRAIEELLADDTIDDIVVVFRDRQSDRDFIRMISNCPELLSDPRVRVASISRSRGERSRFWAILDDLRSDRLEPLASAMRLPDQLVIDMFRRDIDLIAGRLDLPTRSGRKNALFVSSASPAYLDSIAGYVDAAAEDVDVHVLCLGAGADELEAHLSTSTRASFGALAPVGNRFSPLAELFRSVVRTREASVGSTAAERAAELAIRTSSYRLGRDVVGPAVATAEALRTWLSRCADRQLLPDVILMCPQRVPRIAAVAPIARQFGIPTIALEPHLQDANYSRYMKVAADYYGVLSGYFRTQVAGPFGIDPGRVRAVGSPRQVAPVGYEPGTQQRAALAKLVPDSQLHDGRLRLVFFCQPSAWGHVDRIWTTLLRVAEVQDCVVLLKTHPEESVSRTKLYLERAAELGLGDRVVQLDGDAEEAIALGDIMVTAYSSAAFDAVLRRNPVIALTDGELDYPVDLATILGVPLARSFEDLTALIDRYRTEPEGFLAQIDAFLAQEPQLVDGPQQRLQELLAEALDAGSGGIRRADEIPDSLFLDGPHPIYPV